MKNSKISVVIPAYNEEKYIGKCLISLMNQTMKPDEIIVVDNCSTDKTADVAKHFGARVILEPRKGTSYARNTGFDEADGEILARTDADTVVDKRWIENIKKYTSNGDEALTGPVFLDIPIVKSNPHAINAFMLYLRLMFGENMWLGANMIMSKSAWNYAKKYVESDDRLTHEDIDIAMAVNRYCEIKYKKDLVVLTSSRRMKDNPKSLFIEYQLRLFKMAAKRHKKNVRKYYSGIRRFLEQEIFDENW